ncbi:atherin-like isoform X2 [Panicum virgatum]|uniref:Uncharacterized protein n=2 Tax=Panicum virgatum TaxID=38727 RepID=A0A8T0V8S9_PANVG|nr:atherin-like isoform X2 [Panicum virgatum]KAG2629744.1 hypothetical protein PVAP13_3KG449901 [Panicum virgatum]
MNSLPVPSNPAAAPPRDPRRQGSLSVRRLPPGPNPYPVFAASRPTAPAPTLAAAGEGPSGSSASSPEPSAVASPPSRPIHVLRLLPLYGPHLPGFGSHLPPPPPPPSPGFGPRSWRAAPAKRRKRRRWQVQMGSRSGISRTGVGSCKCTTQRFLASAIVISHSTEEQSSRTAAVQEYLMVTNIYDLAAR